MASPRGGDGTAGMLAAQLRDLAAALSHAAAENAASSGHCAAEWHALTAGVDAVLAPCLAQAAKVCAATAAFRRLSSRLPALQGAENERARKLLLSLARDPTSCANVSAADAVCEQLPPSSPQPNFQCMKTPPPRPPPPPPLPLRPGASPRHAAPPLPPALQGKGEATSALLSALATPPPPPPPMPMSPRPHPAATAIPASPRSAEGHLLPPPPPPPPRGARRAPGRPAVGPRASTPPPPRAPPISAASPRAALLAPSPPRVAAVLRSASAGVPPRPPPAVSLPPRPTACPVTDLPYAPPRAPPGVSPRGAPLPLRPVQPPFAPHHTSAAPGFAPAAAPGFAEPPAPGVPMPRPAVLLSPQSAGVPSSALPAPVRTAVDPVFCQPPQVTPPQISPRVAAAAALSQDARRSAVSPRLAADPPAAGGAGPRSPRDQAPPPAGDHRPVPARCCGGTPSPRSPCQGASPAAGRARERLSTSPPQQRPLQGAAAEGGEGGGELQALLRRHGLSHCEGPLRAHGVTTPDALYLLQSPGRDLHAMGIPGVAQTCLLTVIRDHWVEVAAQHRAAMK
eukprot:TRINITY_DN5123_c0_g1_i2.p1 TRINITY_DN5123_c0_g1~~TRINITY_DN5123_c0_g1_i2.p1  ORF type:complete len:595 (+),score=81.78 TRINITY_DN5123_c0_g1_i2:82-1785(+)